MLLKLDDRSEVTQCLLPLLLEDVNLSSGDICFDISRVAQECLRQGSQGALIVIDPAIGDR